MGRYNICVYAIAKDEAKFSNRWMDSMSEADRVVVLDTGSADNTVALLRARGAEVTTETITPWRFDTARNRSLELVPEDTDICVCVDLDEVFHPGWRKALETVWTPETVQAAYRYTWNFNPGSSEGVVFWQEKIHSRHGWRWKHPVHETLEWIGEEPKKPTVTASGVQLDHHADPEKSRAGYLPLLELSVQEDPEDDRNAHYLGREYMFYERWEDCIAVLLRHLSLPSATWPDERAASMRFIARSFLHLGSYDTARDWYLRAIAEAPHLREGYVELAHMLYDLQEWDGVLYFTGCALRIEERPATYICEAAPWGSLPHDLRSIAFDRTGRQMEGLEEARKALELEPDNERIRQNVFYFLLAAGDAV